jgi:hypothetical protein
LSQIQEKSAAIVSFAGLMSNCIPADAMMQIMQTTGLMS